MAEILAPARAVRTVSLLRRLAAVVVAVIGLIFLIVGGWSLVSQGWDRAEGTVGQCQSRVTRTGTGAGSSRTEQLCEVTWQADGASHQTTLNTGRANLSPGEIIPLRVKGDQAVIETPLWVGAGSAGLGAVLIVVAVVLLRRQRA